MRYGAVIVAAGRSERMKRFRKLVNMGDMSIAERVVVNFRRAGVSDIVIVTDEDAEQIEKELRRFNVTCIGSSGNDGAEMFDYAKSGIVYLRDKCDRVLFCPVDVPFFTDVTVEAEMAAMDDDLSVMAVIPVYNGKGGHPLLLSGEALDTVLSYTGDRGMRGACASLPKESVRRITVDDEGASSSADTREDCIRLIDMHNERIIHPEIKVTFVSTTKFFGPGTVSLLKEIDKTGNVREACENCGFSYSKGWTIIRRCEEKFGYPIVDRQAGGQKGGTARVTDKGRVLLAAYEELETELKTEAEVRFRRLVNKYRLTGDEGDRHEVDED